VVAERDNPTGPRLLVRALRQGDIERRFGAGFAMGDLRAELRGLQAP
jgi:hypothetical protein